MSTPEDPFDKTIWDQADSEEAIEDPLHGPSAVYGMLEIPPMPDGNGVYYQPGLGSFAPDHFDAEGRPLARVIGTSASTSASLRESLTWAEWTDAYCNGGEPMLTILEGERQRKRLEKNGFVRAFKPTDVCGGGNRLDECETAGPMVQAAQQSASSTERPRVPGEGRMWNTLAWLGKTCGACSLNCEVAYETQDGEPTGITRFSNTRPLAADVPVVRIGLSGYDPVIRPVTYQVTDEDL